MALEAGGYAEKLGNRYEANWIAYQLLRLLQEKISYVTVEPLGDDEIGVDLIIGNIDGSYEHHQCKASSGNDEHWTLPKLKSSNILHNASFQIGRGAREFHLVSPLSNRTISDLCESALNSNSIPFDFLEHQVKQSQVREKCFNVLSEHLGLSNNSEEDIKKTMLFLRRFKIIRYDLNKHNQSELEDKASSLFSGSSTKLVQFLKYYPVEYNKLRNKITANQLLSDLEKNGFVARGIPEDERVLTVVENLSKEFEDSIKPFLICNQLIKRKELDNITDSLKENAVTLIRAEAGIGKSSLLLELHNYLRDSGVISIPIRLDRRSPKDNLDAFGRTLGFPYSPSLSLSTLAQHNKVVIILDQLDAIRWTGAHSNIALHICQELINQAIALRKEGADITIVLASRDFELNEDIALSSWLDAISESLCEVTLSTLDETKVDELVSQFENYSQLSSSKKEILKTPLWLGIYLTIAYRTQMAPRFDSKLELVKDFWDDRLSQTQAHDLSVEDAEKLINKLVDSMIKLSCLSVSLTSIPVGSRRALEVLISIGILTKQDQRISFRHQALYDYQVGSKLYRAASISSQALLSELGEFDNQTLDKREHLRYALNMLLDTNQKSYCSNIETLLFSDKVRFHLKFLALNSLKDLKAIKAPTRKLINKLVNDPVLNKKFTSTSCYKHLEIIEYLINNSILKGWLDSTDEKLVDASIHLLSSISEVKPELVVTTIRPYVDISENWNERVYSSLCWKIVDDSDDMFELRKELLQKNCSANYIDWEALSKRQPTRALSLIELILEHDREVICKSRYSEEVRKHEKLTSRASWTTTELEDIQYIVDSIPENVLNTLLKKVNDIAESQDSKECVYVWLHKDKARDHECMFTSGLFSIIENSGRALQSEPDKLYEIISPYLSVHNPVTLHLVARLMLNLSSFYSDKVIDWLLEQPSIRLSCGNDYREPIWLLPGKLIEKFSVNCTPDRFLALENCIYSLKSHLSLDEVKYKLEARRWGSYRSYWGQAQHFLLPKLETGRVSPFTRQLIQELNRKFESYSNSDFCSAYESIGGIVTSPLSSSKKLSNKSWTKLILTPQVQLSGKNWKQAGEGVITESSINQFSNSLTSAVENEPIRFAHLALSLPTNIDPQYVSAFFRGLAESNKEKTHEDYRDNWIPCDSILIEKVVFHFPHEGCEHDLVRLLKRLSSNISEKMLHTLLQLAKHAEDPKPDRLNIWDPKKGNLTHGATAKSLMSTSINCVRGQAYIAISRAFFENKAFAFQYIDIIDSAIQDAHPAVNITGIELLQPFLNYDNSFAHTKFIELCTKDIRASRGNGAHYFFNQGFEGEYRNQYIQLVLQMLDSNYEDIRKEAARQIYARWFFNDLFTKEVSMVIYGDEVLRSGCASVLCQFLREDKYSDRIHKVEFAYKSLINSDEKDISQKVGSCIQYDNYWTKHNSTLLFEEFVKSKAVKYCIYALFKKLESYQGVIVDMAEPLLELVQNIVEVDKTDESFSHRHMHIRQSSLLSVLQRIYDEATEDENDEAINTCLDIWDELLYSEIYTAMSAVKELDNGLLS
ncbi:ATP-binding protein [Vibrio crassostreae]|uniref:ATP-binding protein n=1 Tax=Vibrio crassostreae TaxID=246167 RepID=UPI001B30F978|nr:ATP-binding protein [Vibrio crassostreae]